MTITLDGPARATDTLDRVDRMDASEASPERLFGGEGANVSARARTNRGGNNARYRVDLDEMHSLYDQVLAGNKRAALSFTEAMSTSDYATHLFGDILDREILANYNTMPVQWDKIAKRGRVRDFRTVKRFAMDGGEAVLAPVKQLGPYPAAALTDSGYSYGVSKFGRKFELSFETLVNDDLDAFADLPRRLGNAARRTEERFVTDLYAGTTGPDTTYFAAGNSNIITTTTVPNASVTNPPFSIVSLQYAMQVMDSQLDADGAPIYVEGVTLVVPPSLRVAAMNVINATQVEVAQGSGGAASEEQRGDRLTVKNWLAGGISLVVNPWLPLISTTNGHTSWYLFANPSAGRPAMEMGFLMGHEAPELFRKSPNATRVSGGLAAPEDGDFDSDSIAWKCRMIMGGVLMSPKSAVASNGSGS